jgi:hypothetical protein
MWAELSMSDWPISQIRESALTAALQRALNGVRDHASANDLLFLERWEMHPLPGTAAALRVGQLRRANPELAAEIRAEISCGRPLTTSERAALQEASAK